MTDNDIIEALRSADLSLTPVERVDLLARALGRAVQQSDLVAYFKRAYPSVPIRVLLEAGGWCRIGTGTMSDEEFNALLGPGIGDSIREPQG